MKPIRLGDVEIQRVVEIPRSTYPTTDMLPTSSADVIARHRAGWLGRFYDADTGDLMHRVVQVAEPGWSSRFCNDMNAAAKTRRAFVERHADSGVLICAAHFPVPGYVVKAGGEHRFEAMPA